MGIPVFFSWIYEKYPSAFSVGTTKARNCHNLYLDFNGVLHLASAQTKNLTDEEIRAKIGQYLDRLVEEVRPQKLLYIAIDGVAPRGKMNEQRSRRLRTVIENEKLEGMIKDRHELWKKHGLDPGELDLTCFDSNVITVGTQWLADTCVWLHEYVQERQRDCPKWRNLEVIMNDVNVPGEGEHKIQDFMRTKSGQGQPHETHVIFGSDADLFLLAMIRKQNNILILRDESADRIRDFVVCDIKELGLRIAQDMTNYSMKDPVLRYRVLSDFVLLASFIGNDFVPSLACLSLSHDRYGLNGIINAYARLFVQEKAKTITNHKNINIDRLISFLRFVREDEAFRLRRVSSRYEYIFNQRRTFTLKDEPRKAHIRGRLEFFLGEGNLRRDGLTRNLLLAHGESFPLELACELCAQVKRLRATPEELVEALEASALLTTRNGNIFLREAYRGPNKPLDFRDDCKFVSLVSNSTDLELSKDNLKLGAPEWKERYYHDKFGIVSGDLIGVMTDPICTSYLRSVLWVYAYYLSGLPSWTWSYDYHYAPLVDELLNVRPSAISQPFDLSEPPSQSSALMSVLPKEVAKNLDLPQPYHRIMDVLERQGFYPKSTSIRFDYRLIRNNHLAKFNVPFIDADYVASLCKQRDLHSPKGCIVQYTSQIDENDNVVGISSKILKHRLGSPFSLRVVKTGIFERTSARFLRLFRSVKFIS